MCSVERYGVGGCEKRLRCGLSRKESGPKIDPWGTPDEINVENEDKRPRYSLLKLARLMLPSRRRTDA